MKTTTSSTLLEGLKDAGNRTVWREFVDRYRPLLVGYARKLGLSSDIAEDAAQDTLLEFSKAYRSGKYEPGKGRLRSWLFGIAHNRIRNTLRKESGREAPIGDRHSLLANLEARDDLEEIWDREWREAVVRQCLEELREEIQPGTMEAFELFVHKSLPANEVARRLKTTSNAVFCAKHRVLKRIRELIPVMEEVW